MTTGNRSVSYGDIYLFTRRVPFEVTSCPFIELAVRLLALTRMQFHNDVPGRKMSCVAELVFTSKELFRAEGHCNVESPDIRSEIYMSNAM